MLRSITNPMKRNFSTFFVGRLIKKEVNYVLLLNKLRCNNLSKCNCVNFVNSISVNDIENNRSGWLHVMKSHHTWCPVGPPGSSGEITQEEEERRLLQEIMQDELEKYNDEDDKRDIEYLDEILRRAA